MQKVDIPAFRKEIISIVEANRDKITSLETADDHSIFTICGKNYACEVTIKDKWIGYDLGIETLDGMQECGMEGNTDLYPLTGERYEKITLEIYDELLRTVKALFAGEVYFTSNEKYSYTARKNGDGTFSVRYWERKKLLFLPISDGWWNDKFSEAEFRKLNLQVLS